MKVRSTVLPEEMWVRKTEIINDQLFLVLRVRSDINQVEVDDMDGKNHNEYEYEEVEISYPVNVDFTGIEEDYEAIIKAASQKKELESIVSMTVGEIRAKYTSK